jgi:hypothetical protein
MINIEPEYSSKAVACTIAFIIYLIVLIISILNMFLPTILIFGMIILSGIIVVFRYLKCPAVIKGTVYKKSFFVAVSPATQRMNIKSISKKEKRYYWSSCLMDVAVMIITSRLNRYLKRRIPNMFICEGYTIVLTSGEKILLDNYWYKDEYMDKIFNYVEHKKITQS